MEKMQGEYLTLVQKCISFARQFITLPETIEVYFEDCPSVTFMTMDNAAESGGNHMIFNKPWFTGSDRWDNHKVDIEFFAFHELRHLHQQYEIILLDSGKTIHESQRIVEQWKKDFLNYHRNNGGASQLINVSQEVEIDANAYALCMSNFLHIHDNIDLRFSVPPEAMELADERSRMYYKTLPELVKFLEIERRVRVAPQKMVSRSAGKKPGRNDLCPCGSGKKFKKCCLGKGIYD